MIMTTGIGTTYNSLPNIIRAKVSPLKANYSIPVNKSKTKLTMIMTTGIGTTYNSLLCLLFISSINHTGRDRDSIRVPCTCIYNTSATLIQK